MGLKNTVLAALAALSLAGSANALECKPYKEDFIEFFDGNSTRLVLESDAKDENGKTGYRRSLLQLTDGSKRFFLSSERFLEMDKPARLVFKYADTEVAYENGQLSKPCAQVLGEYEAFGEAQKIKAPAENSSYSIAESGKLLDTVVSDECQIREVQPGSVSFLVNGQSAVNHDFVYLLCVRPDRELTLIYPHPKMIKKGIANVQYKPIDGGSISQEEFLRNFVLLYRIARQNSEKVHTDTFPIEADGIIIKDGIKYNQGAKK